MAAPQTTPCAAAVQQKAKETTAHILQLLTEYGEDDYIGEAISQLEHCLQAAHLCAQASSSSAAASPADEHGQGQGQGERERERQELILAALLHDIGHFLPAEELRRVTDAVVKEMRPCNTPFAATDDPTKPDSGSVGRIGHEAIGASYLASLGFSAPLCALVGSHVAAKRYLCAVDAAYHDSLSHASQASLRLQGGPMTPAEVLRWEAHPLAEKMVRLRKCDDGAKIVGLQVPGVEEYRPWMEDHLLRRLQESASTDTAVAV